MCTCGPLMSLLPHINMHHIATLPCDTTNTTRRSRSRAVYAGSGLNCNLLTKHGTCWCPCLGNVQVCVRRRFKRRQAATLHVPFVPFCTPCSLSTADTEHACHAFICWPRHCKRRQAKDLYVPVMTLHTHLNMQLLLKQCSGAGRGVPGEGGRGRAAPLCSPGGADGAAGS